jgi:dTDP-4-dehydrorhamnose reductase
MNTIGPVLITGATGMLGLALTALCDELELPCYPYPEAHLDITDPAAVEAVVGRLARQKTGGVVVNAAAYTDVERAEDDEERAFAVNDDGARNLAEAAAGNQLRFVHVSTDFVFDGAKSTPYSEEDEPNPLSAYGRSKLAGERSVAKACPNSLILRTAWVYGPGGLNFPRKIVELGRQREEIRVVTDEFGSPTASSDLARGLLELVSAGAAGLYHLTASGCCSRFELAQEALDAANLSTRAVPVSAAEFASRAARPANSVLSLDKARRAGVEMPPWQPSLRAYVRQYLADPVAA